MGYRIGVLGCGNFGVHFVELFNAHPLVDEVVVADLIRERAEETAKKYGLKRVMTTLDDLCASDVDAIALFSQRWLHAPQAIQALRAGKHVYSAVPAAVEIEELDELVKTVEETGLTYNLGETSYYRPQTIYCRQRYAKGDFGDFVYGEGHYYHDMANFYRFYHFSGGENWKSTASFPPMLYPTHSVSHVLGVTFRRMTEVSCFGYEDHHPDGVFDPKISLWNNPFSNETGLFRTSDGGAARINEMRRIGAGESRGTIMGTLGAYEEHAGGAVFTHLNIPEHDWSKGDPDTYKFMDDTTRDKEDASWVRSLDGVEITEDNLGHLPRSFVGKKHEGVGPFHPVERLPAEFVGLPNKHAGSHQFLVVDFMEAMQTGKLTPNNVWQAARYNAPGIVAHASAMAGGELKKIPDFGMPPSDAVLMDELSTLRD